MKISQGDILMIGSNQVGKTRGLIGNFIRSMKNPEMVSPSSFINHTAGTISMGVTDWGGAGGGIGEELPGRLFPYMGDVNWGDLSRTTEWCRKCGKNIIGASVIAEGNLWEFCPLCHTVLWMGEII